MLERQCAMRVGVQHLLAHVLQKILGKGVTAQV